MWIRRTEVSGSIGRRRRKVVCQQYQLLLLHAKPFPLTPLGKGSSASLPNFHLISDILPGYKTPLNFVDVSQAD